MRELPERRLNGLDGLGITPACAGITPVTLLLAPSPGDHPRVCGNYNTMENMPGFRVGSPPRVRELQRSAPVRTEGAGITPACAGITRLGVRWGNSSGDHPRVCGNYVYG